MLTLPKSCSDAWSPPDGEIGEITLELASAQAIAAIEMLNTRGGAAGNRASKTIRVMAYQGDDMVMDEEARMLRFPYSTDVAVPETVGPIDRLVLRVESYAGVGGGLNENPLEKALISSPDCARMGFFPEAISSPAGRSPK